MNSTRWRRLLLAFLIVFGALTILAVAARAIVLYQRFDALGLKMDDPGAREAAAAETARLDRRYFPVFLAGATLAAGAGAAWAARRHPAPGAETR